jgi:galactokinase
MSVMVSIPGRIEVLGNHTDYNGGRVLVAPTRTAVTVRVQAVSEPRLTVTSDAFPSAVSQVGLSVRRVSGASAWSNYLLGAVQIALAQWPRRGGLRIHVGGDLPIGAGLASSAALCVATLRAVALLSRRRPTAATIAAWAQRVENDFVGVPVGALDPVSCATGRRGQFACLDFADFPRFERIAKPRGWRLLVFDSGIRRALRAGAYAQRRAECAAAAKALGVARLGILSRAQFDRRAPSLPPTLRRRARHVVEESARVDAAMRILRGRRDAAGIGALLNESQRSSRNDFENSHPAVDALVERLRRLPGVAGARLTGGGFGGAVIAWVRRADVDGVLAGLAASGLDAPRLLDIG